MHRTGTKSCRFSQYKLIPSRCYRHLWDKAKRTVWLRAGDLHVQNSYLGSKGYIFSSPLLVPTANRFSTGSWAIAEGFGGNPCSTACKKLRVFIRAHVPGVLFYSKRKRENRQNQTLLNRNKSCPSLSFRWPELLSRVLEKNLNIVEPVAFQQNRNAATTQTNNLLGRSIRETTASDSFENQSRLCEIEVWVMWHPVNQTGWTNWRAYRD